MSSSTSTSTNWGTGSYVGSGQGGYVSTPAGPWMIKEVVYVSIIGLLMLAAFLEWFLWLAAFIYCLVKVYQKANTWSIKLLAVLTIILFFVLRSIFLPIIVVTLPLPPQVTQYFPENVVRFLQWFAFWAFAGLLTIPWLCCAYQLVTNGIGRNKRIKHILDEYTAPKVVIVIPCYKEVAEVLLRTVDSIVDCDYPPSCMHLFLSFDGDQQDELYLKTIEKLGVPLTLDSFPKSIDVVYRSCRVTVSRFQHGGKRSCQKYTFRLIDKIYVEYLKRNDNLFILFIDSDCILDRVCIQNFMYEMELKPGSKGNMLAMTGVITSTTEKNTFITLLQDMEYIHGQLFERSVESGCGAVTCLPGALTILRFSAFRRMSKYYFADKAELCEDLFDYGKCHLGEDRWLTHLFMIAAKSRYQIQMNTGAFCKTEAVQTYRSLLKQRRRWFLGFITNEACMLTDVRLWKRYPLLCVIRFAQNTIRTTALLFFIMVISLITTTETIGSLPVGFIGVSLGMNWLLMLYFGAKLGRYKIMLYPLMFIVNPFFNWCYMVYGIFTAGQRTWGGPRVDAGKCDTSMTVQQAIEQAEATGDDLNVVPESFHSSAYCTKGTRPPMHVPLQPPDSIDGRFTPAEPLPGGWYNNPNDSGVTFPDAFARHYRPRAIPLHPRDSLDSVDSFTTAHQSVYLPRRIESFLSPEDALTYHLNQHAQKPPGGAYYEHERTASVGGVKNDEKEGETKRDDRPSSVADDIDFIPPIIRPHPYQSYPHLPHHPSLPTASSNYYHRRSSPSPSPSPSSSVSPSRPPMSRRSTSISQLNGPRPMPFKTSEAADVKPDGGTLPAAPAVAVTGDGRDRTSVVSQYTSPLARKSWMRSAEDLHQVSHESIEDTLEGKGDDQRDRRAVQSDNEDARRPKKLKKKSRR